MSTYVALLRAVNLGGHGKLAMDDFRTLLAKLGYANVETYIQSGNAVFDATGPAEKVSQAIAKRLQKLMGKDPGVFIRTHVELGRVVAGNPYAVEAAADGTKVHVVFLSCEPPKSAKAGLDRIVEKYPARRDRYHLAGDTLYLCLPDGAAATKFTGKALDRACGGVSGTARNWKTVLKLHQMSAR